MSDTQTDMQPTPGPWEAGNNGVCKMRWFVCRVRDTAHPAGPLDYQFNAKDELRRFGSYATAQRLADKLNQENVA